jgi:hypothetical protein
VASDAADDRTIKVWHWADAPEEYRHMDTAPWPWVVFCPDGVGMPPLRLDDCGTRPVPGGVVSFYENVIPDEPW